MENQIDVMTDQEIDAVSGGTKKDALQPITILPIGPIIIICPPYPGAELTADAADM